MSRKINPVVREVSRPLDLEPEGSTLTVGKMLKQINLCLKKGFVKKSDKVLLAEPGKKTYIVLKLAAPSMILSDKYNYENVYLVFGRFKKRGAVPTIKQ